MGIEIERLVERQRWEVERGRGSDWQARRSLDILASVEILDHGAHREGGLQCRGGRAFRGAQCTRIHGFLITSL